MKWCDSPLTATMGRRVLFTSLWSSICRSFVTNKFRRNANAARVIYSEVMEAKAMPRQKRAADFIFYSHLRNSNYLERHLKAKVSRSSSSAARCLRFALAAAAETAKSQKCSEKESTVSGRAAVTRRPAAVVPFGRRREPRTGEMIY